MRSARNAGLRVAQGEYVGFVDGDDWVDPTMFKKLYDQAVQSGADIIQGGLSKYYEAENRYEPVNEDWVAGSRTGNRLDQHELLCIQPTIWRRIYRHLCCGRTGSSSRKTSACSTISFQAMSLGCGQTMAVVNEPLYYYRLQRQGQDVGATDDRLYVHFRLFEILSDFITENNRSDLVPPIFELQVNTHTWGLQRIGEQWKEDYFHRVCEALSDPMWNGCTHPSLQFQCFLAKNYSWYQAVEQGKVPLGLRTRRLSQEAFEAACGRPEFLSPTPSLGHILQLAPSLTQKT